MEDLSGKQFGQYRVIAPLGRGGMASVFKAHHMAMDRIVALKVLPKEYASDPNFSARFRQEARLIAALDHPNILPVYDFGETDGYTYLVMRFVEGGTLSDLIKGSPLPLPQINKILQQLASALDYAHVRGLVHRDIKPTNVLMENGRLLLTDFGIAKMIENNQQFTQTGSFIGTPQYASPEQGLGQELDGRSDIYSLGVILYEMVTGRQPFNADTPMAVVFKHINDPLPPARSLNPALSTAVEQVIQKALAKKREDRYPKASDLARAFEAALQPGAEASTYVEPYPVQNPGGMSAAATRIEAPNPTPPPVSGAASYPIRQPARKSFPLWAGLIGGAGLLALCLLIAAGLGLLSRLGLTGSANSSTTQTATLAVAMLTGEPVSIQTDQPQSTQATTPVPPLGADNIFIEYILDASGSMLEPMDNTNRLEIARRVLTERVAALPPDIHVGLRVYGHRVPYQQEQESCADIELVVPIQQGGAQQILAWLPTMQALGMTPMSESIRQAAEDFTFNGQNKNSIILISDGIETCGDDPGDVAAFLQELGIDFTIHVIGLGVDDATRDQLSRLASVGKGVYHHVNSEQELIAALEDIKDKVVEEAITIAPTPQPSPTVIPVPNFDASFEGTVTASSIYPGFPASLAIDGDLSTSWFSLGPAADNGVGIFTWSNSRDDLISSIEIISNRENQVADYRTGFGFDEVTVQVLDASGAVVFEQSFPLGGTPDPDVQLAPNVVGRTVVLKFTGHESLDCGGFGELKIGVTR